MQSIRRNSQKKLQLSDVITVNPDVKLSEIPTNVASQLLKHHLRKDVVVKDLNSLPVNAKGWTQAFNSAFPSTLNAIRMKGNAEWSIEGREVLMVHSKMNMAVYGLYELNEKTTPSVKVELGLKNGQTMLLNLLSFQSVKPVEEVKSILSRFKGFETNEDLEKIILAAKHDKLKIYNRATNSIDVVPMDSVTLDGTTLKFITSMQPKAEEGEIVSKKTSKKVKNEETNSNTVTAEMHYNNVPTPKHAPQKELVGAGAPVGGSSQAFTPGKKSNLEMAMMEN